MSGWEHDARLVDTLLGSFSPRLPDGQEFALQHRTLLLRTSTGTALDVVLGALPFEERSAKRASFWRLPSGRRLRTCSAEDPIVHKAFAARERDWVDIEGVLLRQGATLNVALIREELSPLVALKEEPAILTRLEAMFRRARLD